MKIETIVAPVSQAENPNFPVPLPLHNNSKQAVVCCNC